MSITRLQSRVNEWIDLSYFMRFLVLLLVFYYGNLAFIAVIDTNGRVYSAFLDNHLNYINWLRNSYLYTSNALARVAGFDSHVVQPYKIATPNGTVTAVYDCLGVGIFCFWTAFLWANIDPLKFKIKWWLAGLLTIWTVNNFRMTLLLMAVDKKVDYNYFAEHHTLYNLISYTIIALFIVGYTRANKQYIAAIHP